MTSKEDDLSRVILHKNGLTNVKPIPREQSNPIEPEHYNQGEIDLYDSWYLTYPFNEFKAGMQMITDRYIRRNKVDRLEDLDKAIYTLERLKEYETLEMFEDDLSSDDFEEA